LPDLIVPCLTPIVDQIAAMKFGDLQASCNMGHSDLKLPLHVEIDRAENGQIDALRATIVERNATLDAIENPSVFACEINIACGIPSAMHGLCTGLLLHLIKEEVERRFTSGRRDLLRLTDRDLMELQESMPFHSRGTFFCGAEVEEILLREVVEREISARKDRHSAHAHFALLSEQKDCLDEAEAEIEEEMRVARLSRPRGPTAERYQIHSSITDEELAVLNLRHEDLFIRLRAIRYR
tara:strand:- start:5905 stop:6621 length:717 start_codon:yes stop_codon:yes gene_type:complete